MWRERKHRLQFLIANPNRWNEEIEGNFYYYKGYGEIINIISFISARAIEIENLFQSLSETSLIMTIGSNKEVALTQRQCLCLLCNAFFGFFRDPNMDGQRFSLLNWGRQPAKMKCFIAYLTECENRIRQDENWVGTNITFIRRSVPNAWTECFNQDCSFTKFHRINTPIEKVPKALHADFANEYIGGGVLGGGCVQEEIRFTISPECLVSILLCERMDDNEAILIRGTEIFSWYNGYAWTFQYAGPYVDPSPIHKDGYRESWVVAFDALPLREDRIQYRQRETERELVKVTHNLFLIFIKVYNNICDLD
jgi:poly(ADP-ribose) glycohydrolase